MIGVLLALLLSFGCATAPPPAPSDAVSGERESAPPEAVEAVRPAAEHPEVHRLNRLVFIASPESLREARRIADGLENGGPRVRELRFLISSVASILYPEWSGPEWSGSSPPPPSGSIYPGMLQDIRDGRFPRISQQDTSNLTLLLAPLSILFSTREISDAALIGLDRVEAISTLSVIPPYLRGVAAERQGRREEAVSWYEEAVRRDRSCYPAAVAMARLIMDRRPSEAAALLADAYDVVPRSPSVTALLAGVSVRMGRRDDAVRYLERSLSLDPQQPDLLLLRAELLADEGRWREALLLMQAVDAKTPESHDKAYLEARILYHGTGDIRGALRALEQYEDECIGKPGCGVLLGKLLLASGEIERGRAVLAAAAENEDAGSEALLILLSDAVEGGEYPRAERFLSVLRTAPAPSSGEWLPVPDGLAYRTYAGLGKYPEALPFAERLYRREPRPEHAAWYARTLIVAGRRSEASGVIDRGLAGEATRETRSDLLYLRSRIRNEESEAERDLIASLFEHPANVETLLALADRSVRRGEYTRARLYLRQAESVDPENEKVQAELERIGAYRSGSAATMAADPQDTLP